METFDLYDRAFRKLDKQMHRGETNGPGEYHLVVHVWIRNSQGQYLIQQRNKANDRIPYQWSTTAGSVLAGETSQEGACRETFEEIGLVLHVEGLRLLQRYWIEGSGDAYPNNYITDLYLYEEDVLLNELKLDTVEVRNVAYKTMDEIRQMIRDEQFWDFEWLLARKGYFALLEKS